MSRNSSSLFQRRGITRGTILGFVFTGALLAATTSDNDAPLTPRERAMLARIEQLESRLAAIEARQGLTVTATAVSTPLSTPGSTEQNQSSNTQTAKQPFPVVAPGTTLNVYLDGYYGYNFNHPVGRVNLLRSNDLLSNSFSLNQFGLIIERAPDVAAGRRFGVRADLMFGQSTDSMQGSAANEPRPSVYRNIYQAYGTYVLPAGHGLTLDFGKFASVFGAEGNYAFSQWNYSRSYYFGFLPFYHMGFRTSYDLSRKVTLQYWLVNGEQQTEDFNGFKSNAFLLITQPAKSVSWQFNYYTGQENRDLVPILNPGLPSLPTQPGLSVTPVAGPRQDGRTHLFDTYSTWNVTPKLALKGEFDYVVARTFSHSAPAHGVGGAGYLQYRFHPKFNIAGRYEYLSDRGGLFSGITQALKEATVTGTYQPAEGVQMRLEWRRDFSNRPFFLTDTPGVLSTQQNTATLGMIWWFGGKREGW